MADDSEHLLSLAENSSTHVLLVQLRAGAVGARSARILADKGATTLFAAQMTLQVATRFSRNKYAIPLCLCTTHALLLLDTAHFDLGTARVS